jgi:uncharacterized protein
MMIYETIISTVDEAGKVHITPFGVRRVQDLILISPFKPSTTLNNILSTGCAVMNLTDDVRVFAGAVVKALPVCDLLPATKVTGFRLAHTLAHQELELVHVLEDELRPELQLRAVHQAMYQPFMGFNRAQAAVIEMAVLVSRLNMLTKEKVTVEQQYLQIAIDKTAGEREQEAWGWLIDKVNQFYALQDKQYSTKKS